MRVLVIAGLAESLINFRGPLIAGLTANGHEVTCCAPGEDAELIARVRGLGASYLPIDLDRTGINPRHDLRALGQLTRIMKRIKPEVVLSYTIKPVVYGSIAASLAGVPSIFSMITGLGYAFMGGSLKQRCINLLVCALYRFALAKNKRVFFQNRDDLQLFLERGLLKGEEQAVLINGSGVDLRHFTPQEPPEAPVRFLLIARLLRDKGIHEYVQAAGMLREKYPEAVFQLLGPLDSNPSAISKGQVEEWVSRHGIDYLGTAGDVRPHLARSSVYVLPSYREGTPRTVLEAMSTGRPIITTDAPGCRETVRHGENGLLVPVKDAHSLAQAMESFILSPDLAVEMGRRSRVIAEEKYDVLKVNEVIMTAMELHGGAS